MLFTALFSFSLFASAFLMFSLEPMLGKAILPLLGGSSEVWNTCMAFYLVVLLAGYLYSHLLASKLSFRKQFAVHAVLLAGSFCAVPVMASWVGDAAPAAGAPVWWTLKWLACKAGLPFFVLSTTSPLLSSWFVALKTRESRQPYFLYAASNLGSFAALFAYPLYVETTMKVAQQFASAAWGYGLFAALVAVCGLAVMRRNPGYQPPRASSAMRMSGGEAFYWLLLSFVPSSLMLGLTSFLTLDVSPMPLLWIIPLALYLLTWVLTFSRLGNHLAPFSASMQAVLALALLPLYVFGIYSPAVAVLHLLLFFFIAMVCHGQLAAARPEPERLTSFYLMLSLGGALGGVFNSLVAPMVFNTIVEYPLVLALALLVRPGDILPNRNRLVATFRDVYIPLAIGGAAIAAGHWQLMRKDALGIALVALCGMLVAFRHRPLRLTLGAVVMGMALQFSAPMESDSTRGGIKTVLLAERNFYGAHKVEFVSGRGENNRARLLRHGSTLHGAQFADAALRKIPLSYYGRKGPLGDIFDAYDKQNDAWRVASVGMGTAAASCYAKAGQAWEYYEIDRSIADLSTGADPMFTYYKECTPEAPIHIGDARVVMSGRPESVRYDLIILDAFMSDSIPAHLLTREAFELYLKHLAPGGVIAVHISNRHLRLEPVVAAVAGDLGLAAKMRADTQGYPVPYLTASQWMAVARTEDDLNPLAAVKDSAWTLPTADRTVSVWTDDFHNIWQVFKW
ncbi:hypothetical protein FACS1894186_0900 [Alphaproteobacteria bacterium]|nr:hypothetical protein FACS1894186_0900 [Alphaproteobacteria bacterium]